MTLRSLIRRVIPARYDPVEYWNSRSNPNNEGGTARERVEFDSAYIRSVVGDLDPIFELGPGVGRTFGAYAPGRHVVCLDISRQYADQLAQTASTGGLALEQHFQPDPSAPFPFHDKAYSIGVASQVLLHVPPEVIVHTMNELQRVCDKVVVISLWQHNTKVRNRRLSHVFNHDYPTIASQIGSSLSDVITNEGRILFTMAPSHVKSGDSAAGSHQ